MQITRANIAQFATLAATLFVTRDPGRYGYAELEDMLLYPQFTGYSEVLRTLAPHQRAFIGHFLAGLGSDPTPLTPAKSAKVLSALADLFVADILAHRQYRRYQAQVLARTRGDLHGWYQQQRLNDPATAPQVDVVRLGPAELKRSLDHYRALRYAEDVRAGRRREPQAHGKRGRHKRGERLRRVARLAHPRNA